ncbi:MAG: N-formylglutamate amidohydrolase, partial [Proteobacteria bacterium]|nr:N-formylglutamate amidohydrolase [Pseudomonadota bacterium]
MRSFELITPPGASRPVLVEIPHAGLAIPEEVLAQADLPMDTVLRDADIYVDQLFANAPKLDATMLVARHSRYVVDLNR